MAKYTGDRAWSDEDKSTLKRLVAAGMKDALIAAELGRTRNAVIGARHRMKIPSVHSPSSVGQRRKGQAKARFVQMRSTKRIEFEDLARPLPGAGSPVPLVELDPGHCRYPVSYNGTRHLFCGEPTETRPYCRAHMKACYRKEKSHGHEATVRTPEGVGEVA